jgi:hypothetical protein
VVVNTGRVTVDSAVLIPDPVVVREYYFKDQTRLDRYVYDAEFTLILEFKRSDKNIARARMAFIFYYPVGAQYSLILVNGQPYDGSKVVFEFTDDVFRVVIYARFVSAAWVRRQPITIIGVGTLVKEVQYSGGVGWIGDGYFIARLPVRVVGVTPGVTPSVEEPGGVELDVEASAGGRVDPPPGAHYYTYGSTVVVRAEPEPGYILDSIIVDGVPRSESSVALFMNGGHVVEARFKPVLGRVGL